MYDALENAKIEISSIFSFFTLYIVINILLSKSFEYDV